jgi:glucoamylase
MNRLSRSKPRAALFFIALALGGISQALADDAKLNAWIDREAGVATTKLFANISPSGTATGVVIASPSQQDPNYFFHWVRDSALTMNQVMNLYESDPANRAQYRDRMRAYATLSRTNQTSMPPPNTPAVFGLGEPKFFVNGQVFTGPWGRPQNDGSGLRAITLIRFAEHLLDEGNAAEVAVLYDGRIPTNSVIKADLEFVGHHWSDLCFDLWEETSGLHFYTRMAQQRGLLTGARFARRMNDKGAGDFYAQQAGLLRIEIAKHWDEGRGYILATLNPQDPGFKPSQLDVAVVLGALHADSASDPFFGPSDDRVLATAQKLAQTFRAKYMINQVRADGDGNALQPGIGRYPEDSYDGNTRTGGNPWFLATSALAELSYRAAARWTTDGHINVTPRNIGFLQDAIASQGAGTTIKPGEDIAKTDSRFVDIITSLIELGDGYLRRVRQHSDQGTGSLSEEFNKDNGFMQGARDLTWSYAAISTAFQSRSEAKKLAATLAKVPAPVGAPRR